MLATRRMARAARDRREPWDIVVIGGGATGVGRRGRCGHPRLRRAAARAARLRQGHVEPQHQARPRRRPLPRAGQHLARDGGAEGARPAAAERAAPRPRPAVRRPELRLVGGAVLRHRPEGLRPARRQVRLRRRPQILSREETLAAHSRRSRPDGLRGGVIYHDGQFDDARLLINLAQTAADARRGAAQLRAGRRA